MNTFFAWLSRIGSRLRALPRAKRDILAMAAIAVPTIAIAVGFELFELMHEFARDYEDYEVDELFSVAMIFSVLTIIYSYRRNNDLLNEIEAREAAQDTAMQLANNDPLTGLANRRHFEAHLHDIIAHDRTGIHRALFVLDLDGFKPVNDVYGHQMGDLLLVEFAALLIEAFGVDAFIARLGGDEFAVLTKPLADQNEAVLLADGLIKAMAKPIVVEGTSLSLSTSVGCVVLGGRTLSADEAMRSADDALYRAKENGKNQATFADEALDEARRRRTVIETKLRAAIRENRIVPHFQPIVDLKTTRVCGYEALARWHDPEEGMIPPSIFIPVAETGGLIADLTEHLLRQSLLVAKSWPDRQMLAFNLSAIQLRDRQLPFKVAALLGETGVHPSRLEVEVTESAFIADLETAQAVLGALRELGVRVALDDFGTGYSSLYHLRALKFDKVKIDRSFVSSLATDHQARVIVGAILGITRAMGVTTTAEGIEDATQLGLLLEEGCSQGQGYLFGKAEAKTGAADDTEPRSAGASAA